jgi:hypothetical protein
MSYLYMRECAKEMTESELWGNYWSQSNTVRESYRSQDKSYRSHSEGNGSYTAYVGSCGECSVNEQARSVVHKSSGRCTTGACGQMMVRRVVVG